MTLFDLGLRVAMLASCLTQPSGEYHTSPFTRVGEDFALIHNNNLWLQHSGRMQAGTQIKEFT